MFHIGRSGSTVLGDMLQQHPKVVWDGEVYEAVFSDWETDGDEVVDRVADFDPYGLLQRRMTRASLSAYGFEVKPFHLELLGVSSTEFVSRIRTLGVTHFIVLERRNHLRKVVSSLVAHSRGSFHTRAGRGSVLSPVSIDVASVRIDRAQKTLVALLESYERQLDAIREALRPGSSLELTYEDDIAADPCVAYRKACSHLGLVPNTPQVRYGKTNPFPLRQIVQNWDEVCHALAATRFAWMLED